jgi:hypothetical protein
MKKDLLVVVIIVLTPFAAWIIGAIDLHLVSKILIGNAILLLVIGLLSRFGRPVPQGDVSYFYPINTTPHAVVLGLIALVVGFILIWLF